MAKFSNCVARFSSVSYFIIFFAHQKPIEPSGPGSSLTHIFASLPQPLLPRSKNNPKDSSMAIFFVKFYLKFFFWWIFRRILIDLVVSDDDLNFDSWLDANRSLKREEKRHKKERSRLEELAGRRRRKNNKS